MTKPVRDMTDLLREEISRLKADNAELAAALSLMLRHSICLTDETLDLYWDEPDSGDAYGWDLGRWRQISGATKYARAVLAKRKEAK